MSENITQETASCVSETAAASELPADRVVEDFHEGMPQFDFKMKVNF